MVTYYEVLGVSPRATPEDIRRAYLDLARALHPDTAGPGADVGVRARRMQEINEAWRVLRDPAARRAYDRTVTARQPRPVRRPVPEPGPVPGTAVPPDDPSLDVPYRGRPVEPGDIGVGVVRALPWLALAVIVGAIFVFTAFAAGDRDTPNDLVGECVLAGSGSDVVAVPCEGPNDGEVVLVVDRSSLCPDGTSARALAGGRWLCIAPQEQPPGAPPPAGDR